MPGCGISLLLFPWAITFIPIASATQLLNWEILSVHIRAQLKSSFCYHPFRKVKKIKVRSNRHPIIDKYVQLLKLVNTAGNRHARIRGLPRYFYLVINTFYHEIATPIVSEYWLCYFSFCQ